MFLFFTKKRWKIKKKNLGFLPTPEQRSSLLVLVIKTPSRLVWPQRWALLEQGWKEGMDMAWNISKRKGNQMLTKHWALEVTSDCCALAWAICQQGKVGWSTGENSWPWKINYSHVWESGKILSSEEFLNSFGGTKHLLFLKIWPWMANWTPKKGLCWSLRQPAGPCSCVCSEAFSLRPTVRPSSWGPPSAPSRKGCFFSVGLNPVQKSPLGPGRARATCHSAYAPQIRAEACCFVGVLFIFHAVLPLGFCSLGSHCLEGSELSKVNVLKN